MIDSIMASSREEAWQRAQAREELNGRAVGRMVGWEWTANNLQGVLTYEVMEEK